MEEDSEHMQDEHLDSEDPEPDPNDDTVEEARSARKVRVPRTPTQAEINDHLPLHLPYREWCPHCVDGGASGMTHKTDKEKGEPIGNTICMDYTFPSDRDAEEDANPILIMYDCRTRALWCIPTDHKGAIPWVTKWAVDKLEEAGYGGADITIKTDGEPAILDLKKAIAAARLGNTTPIESGVRQSKENGGMENAVRIWQRYFRTIRAYFEDCVGKKMVITHKLYPWMVVWCSDALTRYKVHTNGRTSFEMMTGHRAKREAPGFGEIVKFRLAPEKSIRHKAESEWMEGMFVGVISRTTEYILMCQGQLFKTSNIKRACAGNQYDKECLTWATIDISELVNKGAATRTSSRPANDMRRSPDTVPGDKEYIPRKFRINDDHLKRYGYTVGCPECVRRQTGIGSRTFHTDNCRTRLEEEIMKDEKEREKLERSRQNYERWKERKEQSEANEEAGERGGGDNRQAEGGGRGPEEGDAPSPDQEGQPQDDAPDQEGHHRGADDADRPGEHPGQGGGHREDEGRDRKKKRRHRRNASEDASKRQARVPESAGSQSKKREQGEEQDDPQPGAKKPRTDTEAEPMNSVDRRIIDALLAKKDVTEVFSPERVTLACRRFMLRPGSAMDLRTGFDFDKLSDRQRARAIIREECPWLLVGSPPCTPFSLLQRMNVSRHLDDEEWLAAHRKELEKGRRHIKFCCQLYREQARLGRYFVHEHPKTSAAWGLPEVKGIEAIPGVRKVEGHMCQFGMVAAAAGKTEEHPVKKPTLFLTNSFCVADELSKTCNGDHEHTVLLGKKLTSGAAIYPAGLCDAMCRGIMRQKEYDAAGQTCSRDVNMGMLAAIVQRANAGHIRREDIPNHWTDRKHEEDGMGKTTLSDEDRKKAWEGC